MASVPTFSAPPRLVPWYLRSLVRWQHRRARERAVAAQVARITRIRAAEAALHELGGIAAMTVAYNYLSLHVRDSATLLHVGHQLCQRSDELTRGK